MREANELDPHSRIYNGGPAVAFINALGSDFRIWDPVAARLADRFRLSIYDAAYLELAQRRALPLATLDEELCSAAATLGVRVLGGTG